MYTLKFQDIDKQFVERSTITREVDPIVMLKHLGINKKYIICDSFKFSNPDQAYELKSSQSVNIEGSADSVISESEGSEASTPRQPELHLESGQLPYHESIKALERISTLTSPREKLD